MLSVKVLNEAGYAEALLGLSLNKKREPNVATALRLSSMDYGHNKFMESMFVWLDVRAPRYWWQEADTYRLSTKQSESTMHTFEKELITASETEQALWDWVDANFEPGSICREQLMMMVNALKMGRPIDAIKNMLPEGFLQRRVWVMSYKTLRNIFVQRMHHRLEHWQIFIKSVREQVAHPEFLPCSQ